MKKKHGLSKKPSHLVFYYWWVLKITHTVHWFSSDSKILFSNSSSLNQEDTKDRHVSDYIEKKDKKSHIMNNDIDRASMQ